METEDEITSQIKDQLEQVYGDQPITWFEIEDLYPACTNAVMEAYITGGHVDPDTRHIIDTVLEWRPSLRWCFELPTPENETRTKLYPHVVRNKGGTVVAIECYPSDPSSPINISFIRVAGDVFSVRIKGLKNSDDFTLILDKLLLAVLPEQIPDEWARVHVDELATLIDGTGSLEVSACSTTVQTADDGQLRIKHVRRQSHFKAAASALLICAISISFGIWAAPSMGLQFPSLSSVSSHIPRSVATDLMQAQKETQAVLEPARGPNGEDQLIAFGILQTGSQNTLAMYRLDGSYTKHHIDLSQSPLNIPDSVSKWYTREPHPQTMGLLVHDVLPDEINPGDELILNRRHRMTGVGVIQICDLKLRVIREIWNRGYIYSVEAGPTAGTLLITGASNRLPESVPSMQRWESYALGGQMRHINPNFVAMIDASRAPVYSGIFPIQTSAGLPRTPTLQYLAQPPQHPVEGLQLGKAKLSDTEGTFARLRFKYFGGEYSENDTFVECDISASGLVIGDWTFEDGSRVPGSEQLSGMEVIDVNRWSHAVDQLKLPPSMTPSLYARSLDQTGGLAFEIAHLRSKSPEWVMDEAMEALSHPDIDSQLAYLYMIELQNLLEPEEHPWSISTKRRMQMLMALSLYRQGKLETAQSVLTLLHLGGSVDDPTHYEAMIIKCLVLAGLERNEASRKLIIKLNMNLSELKVRRQWLVWCDERNIRLHEETIRLNQ